MADSPVGPTRRSGFPMRAHAFRHSAVTTLAIDDPAKVRSGRATARSCVLTAPQSEAKRREIARGEQGICCCDGATVRLTTVVGLRLSF